MKSVRVRSYSSPHFSAFGLNKERYRVSLSIQSECGKIRTGITPNTNTFHAVYSKFRNILYPTSTKILVHWLVKRRHRSLNIFRVPLWNRIGLYYWLSKVSNGLGGIKFLNGSPYPVYCISYHFQTIQLKAFAFCESYVQEILFSLWESKMFRGNSCMLFP